MGVKGLAAFLRRRCAAAFEPACLRSFAGKTIAVDASVLAYRFAYHRKDVGSAEELVHAFLAHNRRWTRTYRSKCIYVFDGPRRVAKAHETARRTAKSQQKLTGLVSELHITIPSCIVHVVRSEPVPAALAEVSAPAPSATLATFAPAPSAVLEAFAPAPSAVLEAFAPATQAVPATQAGPASQVGWGDEEGVTITMLAGKAPLRVTECDFVSIRHAFSTNAVPFCVAPADAERTCAWLSSAGLADIVMSEDYDCLPCGAAVVLRNASSAGAAPELLYLARVLEALDLTREQFVDVCILSGCDFTPYLPRMGPVTAYNAIRKHGTIEAYFQATGQYHADFDYIEARRCFLEGGEVDLT